MCGLDSRAMYIVIKMYFLAGTLSFTFIGDIQATEERETQSSS